MEHPRRRALVADDTSLSRWAISHALESEGFQVVAACTRDEVMGRLLDGPYSLVVMSSPLEDADMTDLVNRLCEYLPHTRVLVLCDRDTAASTKGFDPGAVVLGKPFEVADILSEARAILDAA